MAIKDRVQARRNKRAKKKGISVSEANKRAIANKRSAPKKKVATKKKAPTKSKLPPKLVTAGKKQNSTSAKNQSSVNQSIAKPKKKKRVVNRGPGRRRKAEPMKKLNPFEEALAKDDKALKFGIAARKRKAKKAGDKQMKNQGLPSMNDTSAVRKKKKPVGKRPRRGGGRTTKRSSGSSSSTRSGRTKSSR